MSCTQSFTTHIAHSYLNPPVNRGPDLSVKPGLNILEDSGILCYEENGDRIIINIDLITKDNYQSIKSWLHQLLDNRHDYPIRIEGLSPVIRSLTQDNGCCVWFSGHHRHNQAHIFQTDVLQLLKAVDQRQFPNANSFSLIISVISS